MEKKRFDNLDLLKFIAVLMVLALHVPVFYCDEFTGRNLTEIINYFGRLLSEAVPIFVFVNGFLLLPKEKIDYKKHLLKIGKLMLFYVLWGTLYICFVKYTDGILSYLTIEELIQLLTEKAEKSIYVSQLGFLQGLIALYFLYPIIGFFYKKYYQLFILGFVGLLIVVGGLNTLNFLYQYLLSVGTKVPLFNHLVYYTGIPFSRVWWYVIYFMLGGITAHNKETIKKKRTLFVAIGLLGIFASLLIGYTISVNKCQTFNYSFNQKSVFEILIVLGLYAMTIRYKAKEHVFFKFIRSVSENSFGMYLLNIPVIRFVNVYINEWYRYPKELLFALSFVLCYILACAAKKIPVVKWFVTL